MVAWFLSYHCVEGSWRTVRLIVAFLYDLLTKMGGSHSVFLIRVQVLANLWALYYDYDDLVVCLLYATDFLCSLCK